MPQVPQVVGPRVQQSAGPAGLNQITARASDEALGGGQSLQAVGGAVNKLYEQAKNNADQMAVMDADRQMTELQTKLLYDPQQGILNKKGKDAFNGVQDTNDDFDDGVSDIMDGLSNSQQKNAFQARVDAAKDAISKNVGMHVASEISKYDDESTNSYVEQKAQLAAANPYDIEGIKQAKADAASAIYANAERNGLPPVYAQQKITDAGSKINLAALNQMLASGNDIDAQKYFEANRAEFAGDDLNHATKMVEEGSVIGKSQRLSDDIFQNSAGSYSGALAQARQVEDPKVRDATVQRVQQLFAQKRQAEEYQDEQINKAAANVIDGGGTWQDYAKSNPSNWASMSTSQRSNIMSYGKKDVQTDWGKYYDLKTLAADPDTHQDFMKMDLTKAFNFLAPPERKELIEAQDKLRSNKPTGLEGFQSDQSIVNAALGGMGYRKEDLSDPTNKEVAEFRRQVDQQLIAVQAQTGKKANNDQLRKIVDSLSIQTVTDKGWLWNTTKPVFMLNEETDRPVFSSSDIPTGERKKIMEAMKRNNVPQTDANVMDIWQRKVKQDSGRNFSSGE